MKGEAAPRTTVYPAAPLAAGELRRLRAGRDRLADEYPGRRRAMRISPDRITLRLPDRPHDDCEATGRVAAMLVTVLVGRAFDYAATCDRRADHRAWTALLGAMG